MPTASPLCPSLPLERQHLVAFAERHYGGTLHTLRLRPLRGGLQATGVFRVEAQLRSPGGRLRPAQFVVKRVHSELRREWTVYRTLEAHGAKAIAPRLLDVIHLGATALLFLEWVRPVCAWPWRDVNAAGQVLVRLARLHQGLWKTGTEEGMLWAYDHALHQAGQATLETLQRVVREQGAVQWQAAVPMTFAQARTPTQQVKTRTMVQKWLRVIRRADASWRAG